MGVGGSKVCLMTSFEPQAKKISSPLLLISSNDVPVGWRALRQPYCHYNAPFSFLLLFCVIEWMVHTTTFASTSLPPAHQLTAAFMKSMTSHSTEMQKPSCKNPVCALKWSAITAHAEITIRGWRNNLISTYLHHRFRLVLLLSFDVIIFLISLSLTLLSWLFPHFYVGSSRLLSQWCHWMCCVITESCLSCSRGCFLKAPCQGREKNIHISAGKWLWNANTGILC